MWARLIQLLCVDSQTKSSLNTRAEGLSVTQGNDTGVVDLGLDEGRRVEVRLVPTSSATPPWVDLES